jgi:polyvinyl alcohol dehydrogenase (cytochrome)
MKALVRLVFLCAAPLAACHPVNPNQWPGLGYDGDSTFNNPHETKLAVDNADRLGRLWTSTNFGTVNGSPVVVGNIVYVLSNSGLHALRAATGEAIWSNGAITGSSSPRYVDGCLYVNDAAAVLRRVSASDGREIWQAKVDSHPQASGFSSPTVFGDYVIVGSSSTEDYINPSPATFRGSVVAFDRNSGKELWRHHTVEPPSNGVAVWASMVVDPKMKLVFGATGNNYTGEPSSTSDAMFALNLKDGSLAWSTQLSSGDVYTVAQPNSPDHDFGANPILFEATIRGHKRKLVGAGQKSGTFWALDRHTGAILWSRNVSGGSEIIGGMLNNGAFDGSHILVAGNLGSSTGPGSEPANGESFGTKTPKTSVLEALDPASGAVVWERQLPAWVWAPISVANRVGFVAYETQLQAFDVDTGVKLFNYKTNGTITSAPAIVNGRVFFGSGLTYIFNRTDRTLHALAVDAPAPVDAGVEGDAGDAGDAGLAYGSFASVYQKVIRRQQCATIFCHGGAAGSLLMSNPSLAYTNMVGVVATGPACAASGMKRVDPGHPESSLLLDKIANVPPACGAEMPPDSNTMEAALIEEVRAWILAGAPNN